MWEGLMPKQPKCGLILEQRSKSSSEVVRLNQNMLDVISLSANRYHVSWPCVVVNAACPITLSFLAGQALFHQLSSLPLTPSRQKHHH